MAKTRCFGSWSAKCHKSAISRSPENIAFPPQHIKLEFVKQFVEALNKEND